MSTAKPKKKKRFVSIQHRLMALFIIIGFSLLGLVWWFTAQFTDPLYQYHIYRQLSSQVDQLSDMIAGCEEPISTRPFPFAPTPTLNQDFWTQVNSAIKDGMLDQLDCCVDISDSSLRWVNYYEGLHPCLLHESGQDVFSIFPSRSNHSSGRQWVSDTEIMVSLRRQLRESEDGRLVRLLTTESGARQMVVGRLVQNGKFDSYTVIFSTDLARIDEAMSVIGRLMPLICAVLLLLSMLCAWMLSRWISKPISSLSQAARKMAEGDYTVRVNAEPTDDIGVLAQDFNHMAGQVAASAQLQRELLANVSHDLRTPLTLIKGYAETVRDISGDDPDSRTEQLNVIVDETDRLSGLVNSVMELSRVSSGTEAPQRVRFDLGQLCDEVSQRYEVSCAQNGWTLEREIPDVPCDVLADPAMMERVMHNLLGNATHHLGEDGVFILRVIPLEGGGARVEVEDHGPGIDPEDLPHIFDRYYRSRKDSGKIGTGLGLSITKAILQGHGFRFGVSSTPGSGSCFWFEAKNE